MVIEIRGADKWRAAGPRYRPVPGARLMGSAVALGAVVLVICALQVWGRLHRRPERFPALPGMGKMEAALTRFKTLCERHGFEGSIPDARIVVLKSERLLILLSGTEKLETYRIALGSDPRSPKSRAGDGATPVGDYYVCAQESRTPHHLFLGLSYPNAEDAARAFVEGRITLEQRDAITEAVRARGTPPSETPLGGGVGIHGGGSERDATDGSIGLRNEAIEELWHAAQPGTPVSIQP